MRNKWQISHLEYLHVDLRRLAFRTLFEAVTDAFTKESEQQVASTMALTICENKVTFRERSYAHCSMSRYVHPRTFDSIVGMVAAVAANAAHAQLDTNEISSVGFKKMSS